MRHVLDRNVRTGALSWLRSQCAESLIRRRHAIAPSLWIGLLTACSAPSATPPSSVEGIVVGPDGPVPGATVKVQATEVATSTDDMGLFFLELGEDSAVSLSAQAEGFYIGGGDTWVAGDEAVIELVPHPTEDNPAYEWVSALAERAGDAACETCHAAAPGGTHMPFDDWKLDAHGLSASNHRFLTLYAGTDIDGHASPPTRYGFDPEYGEFPLPPDPDESYFGPGYQLDFPGRAGNCAACHLPAAASTAPLSTDPREVSGVGTEGVTCDVCHKVWDVELDASGLPARGRPGLLSMVFLRPPPGQQIFVGPLDDVAPGEDVFRSLYRESAYCAPCHSGRFWGTPIYGSFDEWLASPYADPSSGQSCQDCHMPSTGADRFALAAAGGRLREPASFRGHLMPGAADEALLRRALRLEGSLSRSAERVDVEILVTNVGAGHHVPTDSPLRQVILLVKAFDQAGTPVAALDGPTVPQWVGRGDVAEGWFAGETGWAWAKVLRQEWTQEEPTAAYWTHTRIAVDNRLAALETDALHFGFPASAYRVEATLLFRRSFRALAVQKGWEDPDIRMAQLSLGGTP